MLTIHGVDKSAAVMLADLGRRTSHETFAASIKAEDRDAYARVAFSVDRIAAELRREAMAFFIAETSTGPVGFAELEAERPGPWLAAPGVPRPGPVPLETRQAAGHSGR